MTDLVMACLHEGGERPEEHWHAATMRAGLLSSVVTTRRPDGHWTVRALLRDRSLRPLDDGWKGDGFATQEAAHRAGEAAALRLHNALVGLHGVPVPPRTTSESEPPGGYQSQALRRYASALRMSPPQRAATHGALRAKEAEKIA